MSLTTLWLFLHIATMFAAVTVSYGITTMLRVAYGTGQVAILRGVGMTAGKLGPLIPILFVSGGLFGLFTGISSGFNLLVPWLVIAYVLYAIAFLIGVTENRTFGQKLGQLLRTTPEGPVTPEVRAMFDDRRTVVLTVVDYVVIVLLIFDMVVKPFSS